MRSESRTEDTSGFTTTTARSAKYIARCAPFSMPAGESHTTCEKPSCASSSSTRCTPSLVSASLSRVCDAASTCSVSWRLSLISACFKVQSPLITLTKSYTTRRSHPMMRSRLRRPMSKSTTATLWPRLARPVAMLALVVVLPTPPLPDVTTMNSVKRVSVLFLAELRQDDLSAVEHDLYRFPAEFRGDFFEYLVLARDRDELRLEIEAVDPRVHVALRAGERAPAQRCVDVHAAVGDDFRAGADLFL